MPSEITTPLTEEQRRIVEENVRLAWEFAMRRCHRRPYLDFDETFSAAQLGLIYAARAWKPELGSLSTCAWRHMISHAKRARMAMHAIRVPDYLHYDCASSQRNEEGRKAAAKVKAMARRDIDPADRLDGTAEEIERRERAEAVRAAVHRLPEPAREIVTRWKIDGEWISVVAASLHMSRQRATEICRRAMKTLKADLEMVA